MDRLDVAILVFLCGVVLVFVGLWLLSPALALIVVGLGVVLAGSYLASSRGNA